MRRPRGGPVGDIGSVAAHGTKERTAAAAIAAATDANERRRQETREMLARAWLQQRRRVKGHGWIGGGGE